MNHTTRRPPTAARAGADLCGRATAARTALLFFAGLAVSIACDAEVIVGGSGRAAPATNHGVQVIVGRPAADHDGASAPVRSRSSRAGVVSQTTPDAARQAPDASAPPRTTDARSQRDAESDRLWILEQELAKERRELENKQRLLSLPNASASDPLVVEMRSRLQGEVVDHERNVAALRRELGRVKAGTP